MNITPKAQSAVAPYRLWIAVGGRPYLMHGQKTPGFNNSMPVRSIKNAKEVAEAWRQSGIAAPYLWPEWEHGA